MLIIVSCRSILLGWIVGSEFECPRDPRNTIEVADEETLSIGFIDFEKYYYTTGVSIFMGSLIVPKCMLRLIKHVYYHYMFMYIVCITGFAEFSTRT